MEPFGVRLQSAIERRGRLCVGVDPHPALLTGWGLSDDARGLATFAATCVDALAGDVAVLKPQSAFFERHGSAGIAALEQFITAARERGALVILDCKRGDIGSTMQGYADAYLHSTSPLAVDAVTVSPYLGFESLRPMLDTARAAHAGVFVLALTSNPEGRQVQQATTRGGTVAGAVLAAVAAENVGAPSLGSVGAVVAANLPDVRENLAVNGPLLAPGFGAQGGSAADLRRIFAGVEDFVLPSTSRAVLAAGPDPQLLRAAALRTVDDVESIRRPPLSSPTRR
jgi:orotidine-5'-phosphate decarboxylase